MRGRRCGRWDADVFGLRKVVREVWEVEFRVRSQASPVVPHVLHVLIYVYCVKQYSITSSTFSSATFSGQA